MAPRLSKWFKRTLAAGVLSLAPVDAFSQVVSPFDLVSSAEFERATAPTVIDLPEGAGGTEIFPWTSWGAKNEGTKILACLFGEDPSRLGKTNEFSAIAAPNEFWAMLKGPGEQQQAISYYHAQAGELGVKRFWVLELLWGNNPRAQYSGKWAPNRLVVGVIPHPIDRTKYKVGLWDGKFTTIVGEGPCQTPDAEGWVTF